MTLSLSEYVSKWVSKWVTIVKNTTREHSERPVTSLTFDKTDEETWPDQQKETAKDKDNDKDKRNDKDI